MDPLTGNIEPSCKRIMVHFMVYGYVYENSLVQTGHIQLGSYSFDQESCVTALCVIL